jgi:AcrR family transcriptional regulator
MRHVSEEWEASLRAHRDQQVATIQQAALELAAERGTAGVGMVDLARRAGISRATLYKYVPSVESALASFMVAEIDREHAELEQRLAPLEDPLERHRVLLDHLLDYFASPGHRSAATVIDPHQFSPDLREQVGVAMARLHGLVHQQVTEAFRGGQLRPGLDQDVAQLVFQHLLTAGRELVVDHRRGAGEVADALWEQYLHGVAPPSS